MSSIGKSFRLSSILKIEEEAMVITKNQGIGSILGSDISDETSTKSSSSSSSLRRTLSADMSSTKCLTQHGFLSPTKKMTSSEELSIFSIVDSSSETEEEEEEAETEKQSRFDMWSSIQDEANKTKQRLDEKTGQFDMWSSLIQQKSQEPQPPPYIHPLVKRSASSLSKKSLEICTESLGSETGSECFSSYPSSESGDVTEDDKEPEPEQEEEEERVEQRSTENFEQGFHPNYNYVAAAAKKPPPPPQRSFPPPIPSCLDGASIRMQSRRDNGRLFLEAVSVPCSTNRSLLAQRQDGRLVLTLSSEILKTNEQEEEEEKKEVAEELEEEFESFDDEDDGSDEWEAETEEGESEMRGVKEEAAPKSASRLINVHGFAFNERVRFDEMEEDIKPVIVAKSLPPMARLIPKSPATTVAIGTVTTAAMAGGGGASVLRGNKEVKSCKEPRRSLLFWEPYCIATS